MCSLFLRAHVFRYLWLINTHKSSFFLSGFSFWAEFSLLRDPLNSVERWVRVWGGFQWRAFLTSNCIFMENVLTLQCQIINRRINERAAPLTPTLSVGARMCCGYSLHVCSDQKPGQLALGSRQLYLWLVPNSRYVIFT